MAVEDHAFLELNLNKAGLPSEGRTLAEAGDIARAFPKKTPSETGVGPRARVFWPQASPGVDRAPRRRRATQQMLTTFLGSIRAPGSDASRERSEAIDEQVDAVLQLGMSLRLNVLEDSGRGSVLYRRAMKKCAATRRAMNERALKKGNKKGTLIDFLKFSDP